MPVEESAEKQLRNVAQLPFVKWIAAMPEVHCGIGLHTLRQVVCVKG